MSGQHHNDRREHSRGNHQQHEEHNEEGWLVSYADLMTLLMGLFVILFSMSNMDKKKYEQMTEELSKQFQETAAKEPPPPPPPAPSTNLAAQLKDTLIHAGLDTKQVDIQSDENGVTISLRGSSFFESGSVTLAPAGAGFVEQVGRSLLAQHLPFEARIEGHTDDTPMNSAVFPSNWELSSARASGVVRKLADIGVSPAHLVAVGYGSSRPLVANRTVNNEPLYENMAQNRRVVVYIALDDKKLSTGAPPAQPQAARPQAAPQAMAPATAVPAAAAPAAPAPAPAVSAAAAAPAAVPVQTAPAAARPVDNRVPASVPAAAPAHPAPAPAAPVAPQAAAAPAVRAAPAGISQMAPAAAAVPAQAPVRPAQAPVAAHPVPAK
jgi:chemotaxis protein MotB